MSPPDRKDRLHTSEGDEGQRSPFQRDRDSLLYSTAFRRLAGVTQVISPAEGNVYHNRLTHTLEVAQIALRLAEQIKATCSDTAKAYGDVDPSVVEAAALAHDLGHPPFGHVAEKQLNELLTQGGHEGYEGNAQYFRIITKLSVRRDESPGLNLTRATLNACLKYPRLQKIDNAKPKFRKWGAYATETDDFQFARQSHGENSQPSLEAQLMDWSDDIAYSIHDTEDFYRAGLIPLDRFANRQAVDEFLNDVFNQWRGEEGECAFPESDLSKTFRELCDTMPFDRPYTPTREQRARLRSFTSEFIGRYVQGTSLLEKPDKNGNLLDIPDEFRMEVKMLKELTWQFVIKGPALASIQYGHKTVVSKLFEVFSNAVMSASDWTVLPVRDRDQMYALELKFGASIPPEEAIRVAADAIAQMTDQQAVLYYRRLSGGFPGSAFDSIVI